MNGMQGADTGQLRGIATAFDGRGDDIETAATTSASEVESVQWVGADADAFRADFDAVVATGLGDLAALMREISAELNAQAEAQDVASGANGSGSSTLTDPQTVPPITADITPVDHQTPSPTPTQPPPPAPTPDEIPEMDSANQLSYDLMSEWIASEDGQTILAVARANPERFNDVLEDAIKFRAGDPAAGMRLMFNSLGYEGGRTVAAAFLLYDNFKTNSVWDMKPYLAEEYGMPLKDGYFYLTDDSGNRIRSDAYGNLVYGAMLAHFGVDEETAILAANGGGETGRGDDPLDDRAVETGYDIYRDHPSGMTPEQYANAIDDAELDE